MPVARWIRRLALAGVLLCFVVVVLGAYVRLGRGEGVLATQQAGIDGKLAGRPPGHQRPA